MRCLVYAQLNELRLSGDIVVEESPNKQRGLFGFVSVFIPKDKYEAFNAAMSLKLPTSSIQTERFWRYASFYYKAVLSDSDKSDQLQELGYYLAPRSYLFEPMKRNCFVHAGKSYWKKTYYHLWDNLTDAQRNSVPWRHMKGKITFLRNVIYIHLRKLQAHGHISYRMTSDTSAGIYGIVEFFVPKTKIPEFTKGFIRIPTTQMPRNERNTWQTNWKRFGFYIAYCTDFNKVQPNYRGEGYYFLPCE